MKYSFPATKRMTITTEALPRGVAEAIVKKFRAMDGARDYTATVVVLPCGNSAIVEITRVGPLPLELELSPQDL